MNYAEEKGFGMESLKSLKNEFGLPFPTYSLKEPFLTLTFLRNTEIINPLLNPSLPSVPDYPREQQNGC